MVLLVNGVNIVAAEEADWSWTCSMSPEAMTFVFIVNDVNKLKVRKKGEGLKV